MSILSWVEKTSDLDRTIKLLSSFINIESVESEPLVRNLSLVTIQYDGSNFSTLEQQQSFYMQLNRILFEYRPLTLSILLKNEQTKTIDELIYGRKTIFLHTIAKELGFPLEDMYISHTIYDFYDSSEFMEVVFVVFFQQQQLFVPIEQLLYLQEKCCQYWQIGLEMIAYQHPSSYAILYKLYLENPVFLEDIFLDSFHSIYVTVESVSDTYVLSTKERVLLGLEWIEREGWMVLPFQFFYEFFLVQELEKTWSDSFEILYSPLQQEKKELSEALRKSYFPTLEMVPFVILLLKNSEIDVPTALLDIKRGWLPETRISIPISNSMNENIFPILRYATIRAYFDVIANHNPFLLYFADGIHPFTAEQTIEIKARFYSSEEINLYRQYFDQYMLLDYRVEQVSSLEDAVTLRYVLLKEQNNTNSLIVYDDRGQISVVWIVIEPKNEIKEEIREEWRKKIKRGKMELTEHLKQYFGHLCKDQKDLISLNEIPDLSLSALLNLIPSSSEVEKIVYCYELQSLEFLSDPYTNPYTNLAFPEEIVYRIDHMSLFWMGLFSIGPLGGLYEEPRLPYVDVEEGTIELYEENHTNDKRYIVNYPYSSTSDDFRNEIILGTSISSTKKEQTKEKEIIEKLWRKGFFLNAWANCKKFFDHTLSIFPERILPYSHSSLEKFWRYAKQKSL